MESLKVLEINLKYLNKEKRIDYFSIRCKSKDFQNNQSLLE